MLVGRRGVAVQQDARAHEWPHQVGRHDGVPQPQRRKEHLAEGAEVDDAIGFESLHGRERVPGVAHLAVVVVFDDPCAGFPRPLQQRRPSPQAHRHAERVLVGRGDEGRRRVRREHSAALDIESFVVHRNPHHAGAPARGRQDRRERGIRRILDPGRITRRNQHLGGQVQPLLCARRDDHLVRVAADGSRAAHVSGNLLAECPRPLRLVVTSRGRRSPRAESIAESTPGVARSGRTGGHRDGERHAGQRGELFGHAGEGGGGVR